MRNKIGPNTVPWVHQTKRKSKMSDVPAERLAGIDLLESILAKTGVNLGYHTSVSLSKGVRVAPSRRFLKGLKR